jgi:hypothetical protein
MKKADGGQQFVRRPGVFGMAFLFRYAPARVCMLHRSATIARRGRSGTARHALKCGGDRRRVCDGHVGLQVD